MIRQLLFIGMLFASIGFNQAQPIQAPQHTLLFTGGDGGSKYYRIPAIITAADNSIIAVADKRTSSIDDLPNPIDVVARRSTDGGRSWSAPYPIACHNEEGGCGDAALVLDKASGDLLCIYASGCGMWHSTPQAPIRIMLSRSKDNGITWSEGINITPQLYGKDSPQKAEREIWGAFAASGRATQLQDGTLLFVIAARSETFFPLYNYVCISTDGGYNWQLLPAVACSDGDESKLIELADGSWLMSIRNIKERNRKYSISTDRGVSWSMVKQWEDMPAPTCNGDLIRYSLKREGASQNRLIHTNPLHKTERQDVALLLSYDEGKTWPVSKIIWAEPAAYSSVTVLPDGALGLLTEVGHYPEGFSIYFTRVTLGYLTDGADLGE